MLFVAYYCKVSIEEEVFYLYKININTNINKKKNNKTR